MRTARVKLAARTAGFTESVIREMTRRSAVHGGINLAQGFPNFAAPQALKDAAKRAIDADINQYAITWGAKSLRDALSRTYAELYGMTVDPETMLTVTCSWAAIVMGNGLSGSPLCGSFLAVTRMRRPSSRMAPASRMMVRELVWLSTKMDRCLRSETEGSIQA